MASSSCGSFSSFLDLNLDRTCLKYILTYVLCHWIVVVQLGPRFTLEVCRKPSACSTSVCGSGSSRTLLKATCAASVDSYGLIPPGGRLSWELQMVITTLGKSLSFSLRLPKPPHHKIRVALSCCSRNSSSRGVSFWLVWGGSLSNLYSRLCCSYQRGEAPPPLQWWVAL